MRRPTRPDRPGSTRVSALTTWASGPTTTRARSRSIADTILRATAEGGRITYGPVKPEMIPRLIEEHLIHGRVVPEWVVGRLAND